jgi:alanine dehydrogenase
MIVGVPKEIKRDENRIAITPGGTAAFTGRGHTVLIERGAGVGSGFEDGEFRSAGAQIVPREEVFGRAEMILKVKEPLPPEFDLLREGQILFTYLHLAPEPELTHALMRRRVAAIAYETVQLPDGSLPLLTPMSEVAGRMATQIGARLLEKPQGGRGVLLGGVPGVPPAEVVVVGGGIVGLNAARVAMGMGALVTILDISAERLRYIDDVYGGRMLTLMSNPFSLAATVRRADLLVGAVLIPGARAPRLVTADMVKTMKPGSVIVDVSIDQGGSIETIDRVTSHSDPTYVCHGVVHYSVPNIPGAVPRTSTFGLTNVTLPYALQLADQGLRDALRANPPLAKGVNVLQGQVTYEAVAAAHNVPYIPLAAVVG